MVNLEDKEYMANYDQLNLLNLLKGSVGPSSSLGKVFPVLENTSPGYAPKQPVASNVEPPKPKEDPLEDAKIAASYSKSSSSLSPEEQKLRQMIQQQMMEGIDQRQQGLQGDLELMRMRAQQSQPIDLSGAYEIARAAGATNAGARYQAPQNTQIDDVSKLKQALEKAQGGITDDQINYLRFQAQNKASDREAATNTRMENRMRETLIQNARNAFKKISDEYAPLKQSYGFVKSEIATGEQSRINRALSQYARMMGEKGVLTDQDLMRQMPASASGALNRAYTWLTGHPEDTDLPKGIVDDLLNTLGQAQVGLQKGYETKANTNKELFNIDPYAAPKYVNKLHESAMKVVGPSDSNAGEDKKHPSEEQINKMSKEELKDYLGN